MSLANWWRKWWPRHRWLISSRPTVDDGHTFGREGDPATDPLNFEFDAERAYDARGRLGDKEVSADQIDIE